MNLGLLNSSNAPFILLGVNIALLNLVLPRYADLLCNLYKDEWVENIEPDFSLGQKGKFVLVLVCLSLFILVIPSILLIVRIIGFQCLHKETIIYFLDLIVLLLIGLWIIAAILIEILNVFLRKRKNGYTHKQ